MFYEEFGASSINFSIRFWIEPDQKTYLKARSEAIKVIRQANTCGLFEGDFAEIAEDTHKAGGYVYADGANFNAIVGRVRPGDLGVDCMHINLHKTFSTPHGGGGPGSGPVVLSEALAPFAPLPYVVHGKEGFAAGGARCRCAGRRASAGSRASTARWACSSGRSPT